MQLTHFLNISIEYQVELYEIVYFIKLFSMNYIGNYELHTSIFKSKLRKELQGCPLVKQFHGKQTPYIKLTETAGTHA